MRLTAFFEANCARLSATREAQAYITDLLVRQVYRPVDLSDRSVVLTYSEVRHTRNLETLQALGDWALWREAMGAEAYVDVTQSIGRASYYRCYTLVPEWRVYEELADNLPVLGRQLCLVPSEGFEPTLSWF